MSRINLAILASGSGTTAEAFVRHSMNMLNRPYDVSLVICNNPNAGVFDRVARLNEQLGTSIEALHISSGTHPVGADEDPTPGGQTIAEQEAILHELNNRGISCVVLMGYMKKVGELLVTEYGWLPAYTSMYQARMLNTHPGLLPSTKGLFGRFVQAAVLKNGAEEAGQTLHLVAADYDDGPVVAENRISIKPDDTPDTLFKRIQMVEKERIADDVTKFIRDQEEYQRSHNSSPAQ